MTTPNVGSPDVAYVWGEGSDFGQGVTEASALDAIKSPAIDPWSIAQEMWKQACTKERATVADLRDGQNGLVHRMDLLDAVSGYGSAVMGYNWNIPHSQWVVLPFDSQLGPAKGVSVSAPTPETGYLTLKKGGLWRVDCHFTVSGFSEGLYWANIGGILLPVQTFSAIYPKFMIEVVNSSGELITSKQYDLVSDLALHNESWIVTYNSARSGAFSHTFVLDDMPSEDDTEAPIYWANVRLSMRYDPIYNGILNSTTCKQFGGTKRSSLIATRWSQDVENVNYVDEVPDGGNLG